MTMSLTTNLENDQLFHFKFSGQKIKVIHEDKIHIDTYVVHILLIYKQNDTKTMDHQAFFC